MNRVPGWSLFTNRRRLAHNASFRIGHAATVLMSGPVLYHLCASVMVSGGSSHSPSGGITPNLLVVLQVRTHCTGDAVVSAYPALLLVFRAQWHALDTTP